MNLLPVNERFHTWQGEGCHLGKSAYFIRLQGCPVKCPWCDSAGTWHPDYVPEVVEKADPEAIAESAFASGCEIVVLTGGTQSQRRVSGGGLECRPLWEL